MKYGIGEYVKFRMIITSGMNTVHVAYHVGTP